jgi:hypothetical protein
MKLFRLSPIAAVRRRFDNAPPAHGEGLPSDLRSPNEAFTDQCRSGHRVVIGERA